MKKISILSALFILFSFHALNAQINKKDFLLGGSFGFDNNNNNSGGASSNTNISPRLGYAVSNNSILYLRLGAGFSTNKNSGSTEKFKSNNFNIGMSWQKLFPLNEKFGWYTDLYGQAGIGTTRFDNAGSDLKSENSTYSFGINPGLYFMINPRFKINADFGGIGYSYSKSKNSSQVTNTNSSFSFNLLNYFGFGFDFIINQKKS